MGSREDGMHTSSIGLGTERYEGKGRRKLYYTIAVLVQVIADISHKKIAELITSSTTNNNSNNNNNNNNNNNS